MASDYVRQVWVDEPSGGTPLSAQRLNHMEEGIEAAAKPTGDEPDTYAAGDDPRFTQVALGSNNASSVTVDSAVAGTRVSMNAAAGVNVNVNTGQGFVSGDVFEVWQRGAGQVTVVPGAGMTLRAPAGAKTRVQYSSLRVWFATDTEFVVDGDTTT